MKSAEYEGISRGWEYIERQARAQEPRTLSAARRDSQRRGTNPESVAQTRFLSLESQILHARSIIIVGADPLILSLALLPTLPDDGSLTVIVTSPASTEQVRSTVRKAAGPRVLLRIVESDPASYLARLNARTYDLIVVSGQASNYSAAFSAASRILRREGILALTDALATHLNPEHGLPDPADRSEKATTLRSILRSLKESSTFQSVLLPVGTGLILARRSDPPRPHAKTSSASGEAA